MTHRNLLKTRLQQLYLVNGVIGRCGIYSLSVKFVSGMFYRYRNTHLKII